MSIWIIVAIVAAAGSVWGLTRPDPAGAGAARAGAAAAGASVRRPQDARRRLGFLALGGLAVTAVLLAVAPAYGFHRDELYFIVAGRHPALGYPDQPSFTPLVSAAAVNLLGLSPVSIRILPAIAVGAVVVITALITLDLGGSARAALLGLVVAGSSGFLAAGHLDSTATYELLAGSVVLWLVVRLLGGADSRLWLAVGVTAGIGLENKDTILLLAAGLAVGVLLTRRDILRSRWPWAAVAIALLLWAPNLAWQAANGLPQATMAGRIAGSADENRLTYVPQLLLLAGPILFPVTIAGLAWLARSDRARSWRPIGIAGPLILLLVFAIGGKSYYAAGLYPVAMAAGAVRLDGWLNRGRTGLRRVTLTAASVVSAGLAAVLVLPVIPVDALASTPIPSIYKESAEQVGWPALAATVEAAVASLPAAQRERAVILTANYGEAGAITLLGTGTTPVYSGHNGFWAWGPPPDDRPVAVLVGWSAADRDRVFSGCRVVARIDNGDGVPNQEQGAEVSVCLGHEAWSVLWPELRHLN